MPSALDGAIRPRPFVDPSVLVHSLFRWLVSFVRNISYPKHNENTYKMQLTSPPLKKKGREKMTTDIFHVVYLRPNKQTTDNKNKNAPISEVPFDLLWNSICARLLLALNSEFRNHDIAVKKVKVAFYDRSKPIRCPARHRLGVKVYVIARKVRV